MSTEKKGPETLDDIIADLNRKIRNCRSNSNDERISETCEAIALLLEPIVMRLEMLKERSAFFTSKAALDHSRQPADRGGEEKKDVRIGCIPAKYLKVDGAWTAIAFNAVRQMYNVRVSGKKGKVVATFSIDGETKFTLETGSLARAIQLACSASNAYIHMNRQAKERRHRRRANARAAAENKEPTDEKTQADMQQVSEVAR